jgi:hypothetical protein
MPPLSNGISAMCNSSMPIVYERSPLSETGSLAEWRVPGGERRKAVVRLAAQQGQLSTKITPFQRPDRNVGSRQNLPIACG